MKKGNSNRDVVDDFEAWLQSTKSGRTNSAKVAFLAVAADVERLMAAGYCRRAIWRYLDESGKYPHRYETFVKHAARYLGASRATKASTNKPTARRKVAAHARAAPSSEIPGFKFNASPNIEDLV